MRKIRLDPFLKNLKVKADGSMVASSFVSRVYSILLTETLRSGNASHLKTSLKAVIFAHSDTKVSGSRWILSKTNRILINTGKQEQPNGNYGNPFLNQSI